MRSILFSCLALFACTESFYKQPVRVVLDDGQVLEGAVETDTLLLETGMGLLTIPIEDVGQVAPVEGGDLSGSGNYVNVWLRNGSELRGRWADPELRMGLEVGGVTVPVDLPMNQLKRFQLLSGDSMPDTIVFRIRTTYGDDFLVDPETTCFPLRNELGDFMPCLDEVVSVAPLDDGTDAWRVQLLTGTVLIAPMAHDTLVFGLEVGPETIEVPLDRLVSVSRQNWSGYRPALPMGGERAQEAAAEQDTWFDNRDQANFKSSL